VPGHWGSEWSGTGTEPSSEGNEVANRSDAAGGTGDRESERLIVLKKVGNLP